jgi:hypothetical protein
MAPRAALIALAGTVLLLAGCGGGSSAGAAATPAVSDAGTRVLETRHPNGQLATQGTVVDQGGAAQRHGAWRTWFDNGQLRWEGSYRNGQVASDRPWREWNPDGSVRDDSGDG